MKVVGKKASYHTTVGASLGNSCNFLGKNTVSGMGSHFNNTRLFHLYLDDMLHVFVRVFKKAEVAVTLCVRIKKLLS